MGGERRRTEIPLRPQSIPAYAHLNTDPNLVISYASEVAPSKTPIPQYNAFL